jgi:hypothetical protein
MHTIGRAAAVLVLAGGIAAPLRAQRTGALLHVKDSVRAAERLQELRPADATAAKADTVFAALVFDPSLAAAGRSSAWTASVSPSGPAKEARIQVNICDLAGALCGARGAASLMLAGPLNKDDPFTRLGDLDGLVGSARVQATYTTNTTTVGAFYLFSGTLSQPSFAYRDTAALDRHTVSHAAYAIEGGGGYRLSSTTFSGSVRWERSYRARVSQNVCVPAAFGTAGTETCADMVLGEPFARDRPIASISAAWSVGGNGAARLTISRDLRRGTTGIDLPVWMIQNAGGGLAGGLRFGYRTNSREVTVALFVSEFKL